MNNSKLYERLVSRENIYMAIFSVESYIFNKELLDKPDKKALSLLGDKYNFQNINSWIGKIKNRINGLLSCGNDDYLKVRVYFNPKKIDKDTGEMIYRPLHTATLVDQITMVAMLNILVFDLDGKKLQMSNMSRLIPHNFYGNRISLNPRYLFKPWTEQYSLYTTQSTQLFAKFHDSHEYKYEVDLDLENFFPSINPIALYNYICDKMPTHYNVQDSEVFKNIVKKLIFLEVINLKNKDDLNRYYGMKIEEENRSFTVGIAQGLPQAYFFANICMIQISKMYENEFKGIGLYYVDDSVIFTDKVQSENFGEQIANINYNIDNWLQTEYAKNSDLGADILEFSKDLNYKIKVHSPEGKSTFTNIEKSSYGERYLKSISRETSKTSFDLNSSYSDEESKILDNRTKAILEAVEKEIEFELNNGECENESYVKKLIKYKKFFKYRNKLLSFREGELDIDEIESLVINDLSNILQNKSQNLQEDFLEIYNNDILGANINFVLNNVGEEHAIKLKKMLIKIHKLLFSCDKNCSYFYKAYCLHDDQRYGFDKNDKYKSLNFLAKDKFYHCKNKNEAYINNEVIKLLKKIKNTDKVSELLIDSIEQRSTFALVEENTNEIDRMILNSIFSVIFKSELEDGFIINKRTNRKINYRELRALIYLRNSNFKLSDFRQLIDSLLEKEYLNGIDYTILEVLKIFKTFVREPKWIDNLILIHKYTCDIWKNGSKHLYFYTLHNQEHAIDLIQNSVKIVRAIDYIQISQNDFYVLFMACYLHDISMVTLPALEKIQDDCIESNTIASDFIKEIETNNMKDSKEVKKLLKELYRKLDSFYESEVRIHHAYNSASEIRSRKELYFIDQYLRDIVAEVSEGHGYPANEIYLKKSVASHNLVSKKFTQIILRFADLLDMSNYRVSNTILNHNINNMSSVSAFHWLSHLLTQGYEIRTDYVRIEKEKIGLKSFLDKGSIEEKLIIKVFVCLSQLTKEDIKHKCKKMNLNLVSDKGIVLNCGEECSNADCNFLCKWFMIKNTYLFEELKALSDYLNSLPDNYFKSKIEVQIEIVEKTNISEEQFSIIREALNDY